MDGNGSRSVVDVEFQLTDDRYPLIYASEAESCQLELLRLLPRGNGRYAEYYSVKDADPRAVQDSIAGRSDAETRVLAREDSTGLIELEVENNCPAVEVATLAAIPNDLTIEGGIARIKATLMPPPDPSSVVQQFREAYPEARLVGISEADRPVPLFTGRELGLTLEERLTDRQLEVLQTAYERGYYERPRTVTGEDLADELDITVATYSQHIRVAERGLLEILFENDVL